MRIGRCRVGWSSVGWGWEWRRRFEYWDRYRIGPIYVLHYSYREELDGS